MKLIEPPSFRQSDLKIYIEGLRIGIEANSGNQEALVALKAHLEWALALTVSSDEPADGHTN